MVVDDVGYVDIDSVEVSSVESESYFGVVVDILFVKDGNVRVFVEEVSNWGG